MFLTEVLKVDKNRLAVTVFAGNDKIDEDKEKDYMVFDEKQNQNSGLKYSSLPADKKDVIGNNDIKQTNHIQVTVNNPTSTVDVQKGIQDGLASKKSSTNLSDQEF